MKNIIFYHPQKIAENPSRGSELRPKKMIAAFKNIGFKVDLVVGDSAERKKAIRQITKNIKGGKKYAFMYAESLNMPVPFTDSHHLPVRPLQDFKFFKFLNNENIFIGLFYRDLYWRDEKQRIEQSFIKYEIKKLLHWFEWIGIKNTIDHLFLPTTSMEKYLPNNFPKNYLSALYPGCDLKNSLNGSVQPVDSTERALNIFYVGGVKPPYYNLRPMIKVMSQIDEVKLVLCCRKEEWDEYSGIYSDLHFRNIKIVHASSNQIEKHYRKADIFLDLRKPEGYLKTTIPIKIFESIGYGVPLLLLSGTEYAQFIENENAGWVVTSVNEAKELLKKLSNDKTKIADNAAHMNTIAKRHTWEKRAQKASKILTNSRNKL